MSELPTDYRDRLDLRERVARIDEMLSRTQHQQRETQKFVAEQSKLMAEAQKLAAEERKLARDRGLAPSLATAITVTSLAALIASAITLAKSLGWL